MGNDEQHHLALDLVNARERIPAFVPSIEGQTLPAGLGVDAVVRVKGVVGTRFNATRQIVGIQLFIPTTNEITVEASAASDPFQLPLSPINGLLSFSSVERAGRLVRLRGTAMVVREGIVYLRDDGGTIEVHAAETQSIRPGDVVEAAGFAAGGTYSVTLEDARVRTMGHGELPSPVEVAPIDVLRGDRDGQFVRMRGRLLHRLSTGTRACSS
jgi:hypothetical protein